MRSRWGGRARSTAVAIKPVVSWPAVARGSCSSIKGIFFRYKSRTWRTDQRARTPDYAKRRSRPTATPHQSGWRSAPARTSSPKGAILSDLNTPRKPQRLRRPRCAILTTRGARFFLCRPAPGGGLWHQFPSPQLADLRDLGRRAAPIDPALPSRSVHNGRSACLPLAKSRQARRRPYDQAGGHRLTGIPPSGTTALPHQFEERGPRSRRAELSPDTIPHDNFGVLPRIATRNEQVGLRP